MRRLTSTSPTGRAENLRAARRREDQLHQQLERGGLAGAVRAEEAEDLAGLDVERQGGRARGTGRGRQKPTE